MTLLQHFDDDQSQSALDLPLRTAKTGCLDREMSAFRMGLISAEALTALAPGYETHG